MKHGLRASVSRTQQNATTACGFEKNLHLYTVERHDKTWARADDNYGCGRFEFQPRVPYGTGTSKPPTTTTSRVWTWARVTSLAATQDEIHSPSDQMTFGDFKTGRLCENIRYSTSRRIKLATILLNDRKGKYDFFFSSRNRVCLTLSQSDESTKQSVDPPRPSSWT